MHYIVYKTKNLTNNKEYIGIHQTKDLNDGYLGSGIHLKRAVSKYGPENFQRDILFSYDNEQDMLTKEAELVNEEWCSWSNTYNICVGGFGGGFKYINSNGLRGNTGLGRQRFLERIASDIELREKYIVNMRRVQAMCHDPERSRRTQKIAVKASTSKDAILKRRETYRTIRHQQGLKNSQFGTFWITNGSENRKMKSFDLIPEGWYRGRTLL